MDKESSKKFINKNKSKKANKGKKRRHDLSYASKAKKMKKTQQKSQKSSKILSDHVECEFSRMDFRKKSKKSHSDDSVIYVETYPKKNSIIDLTKSSHSILHSPKIFSSTSLKLIYQSNSFNKRLQKNLATSLIIIPLKKDDLRNINSTSNLKKHSKYTLDRELLDEDTDDGSEYAFQGLSNADVNEEIKNVFECFDKKKKRKNGDVLRCHLQKKQLFENMSDNGDM